MCTEYTRADLIIVGKGDRPGAADTKTKNVIEKEKVTHQIPTPTLSLLFISKTFFAKALKQ